MLRLSPQELLDKIKKNEEFFFSLFRVKPQDGEQTKPIPQKGKKAKQNKPYVMKPENVDAIVKKALNRLRAKQALMKKQNKGLRQPETEKSPAKRKSTDGEDSEGPQKKKKKKIDKKDKKERRKLDLKGRSNKKDEKNKAAKGGASETEGEPVMETEVSSPKKDAKDEQFLFGKIGTEDVEGTKKKQMGKDFKRHLKNLQDTKDKIAKTKGEDKEKGDAMEEKIAWQNMMEKAKGVKIKDDETLIKKSIKRKEKLKQHSKKKWEKRETEVKEKMAAKQQKRTANIRAKKDEKIKRKVKKMTKKGRLVPGLNAPDL